MESPLVAVVSPLYNAERFVARCIENMRAQTYSNWRYFVLNNASTDATGEIARELAAEDDRIVVVDNEHTVPVMENHNLAVALTPQDAKYMRILQGDDVLRPRCIELSVAVGEAHPSVGVVGSYLLHNGDTMSNEFPPGLTYFPGREVARRTLLGETYPFLTPSGLLFRAEAALSRKPFYDEHNLHGDVMACYELMREWDFGLVHEVLTEVGSNEGSVTSTQSKPLNKLLGSNLDIHTRYGPEFLSEDEYRAKTEARLVDYYDFLGYAVFDLRSSEFWAHHRAAMDHAGLPLSWRRLLARALRCLVENPHACGSRLYRRFVPKAA